jgi:hypothetical protein
MGPKPAIPTVGGMNRRITATLNPAFVASYAAKTDGVIEATVDTSVLSPAGCRSFGPVGTPSLMVVEEVEEDAPMAPGEGPRGGGLREAVDHASVDAEAFHEALQHQPPKKNTSSTRW